MTQLASPPPRRSGARRGRSDATHARNDWTASGSPPQPPRSGGRTDASGPPEAGTRRRGRHATPFDAGFGRVVVGTILGALIPGAGLIMAGQPVAGWTIIVTLFVIVAILANTVLGSGHALQEAATKAVDPGFLLTAAVAAVTVAVIMMVIILWTHAALRRQAALTGPQRAIGALLVLSLLAAIGAPLSRAASYAMIQRSVLTTVFQGGNATRPNTNAVPKTEAADPWAGVARVNLLLIGSDAGDDRHGLRPDSMVLASINAQTGDTVMFSIPRNLVRAPFPPGSRGARAWPGGFGPVGSYSAASCGANMSFCWINAVWQTALSAEAKKYFPGDPNPGLTATEQVVEGVTGLHVDYDAMLDLDGFQDFVKAIGGVTVNVKERLPIGGSSEHPYATEWIEKGDNQHLNGRYALWFARSRWSTSDYDRMRRQRCVIAAAASQTDLLKLARGFPALAASIKTNMQTDIPLDQLSAWVQLGLKVKGAKIRSLPFTPNVYGSYASPDYGKIKQLVQANLSAPAKSNTASPSRSSTQSPKASTARSVTTSTAPTDPTTAQDVKDVC